MNVYDHTRICLITVALKMSGHCSIFMVFNVKYMTLESINDPVFCLTYILYVAPFALHTVYEIVTLACAFGYCVIGWVLYNLWMWYSLAVVSLP